MKKSLVVLLIAVLALSAVFAADVAITVEGEVSASYVYDFDEETATYNVPSLNGELAWDLVLPVAKSGSQYPYIDVAGEIEVDLASFKNLAPAVDFDTFKIVGEDWEVDFLAKIGTFDYAVSAIDVAWYNPTNEYLCLGTKDEPVVTGRKVSSALTYIWVSDAYYNDAVSVTKDGIGTIVFAGSKNKVEAGDEEVVAVFGNIVEAMSYASTLDAGEGYIYQVSKLNSYPEDNVYAVSKVYDANSETAVLAVEAESKEFKLSDSVKTQFAAGFGRTYESNINGEETKMNAGFSTKSSYADILSFAADFGYDFDKDEKDPFSFDVAANFTYDAVAIDVYATNGDLSFCNTADLYAIENYYAYYLNYSEYNEESYYAEDLLLSAKASVDVEEIGTEFTFTGTDLLYVANLSFTAVNTYFDNYTFTYSASSNEIADEAGEEDLYSKLTFKAEADYTEEIGVTAYASLIASRGYDESYTTLNNVDWNDPVFSAGVAYEKDGLSLSVDFSTAAESYLSPTTRYAKDSAGTAYTEVTLPTFALAVKAGYEAETFTLNGAVEYNTHETSAYKWYKPWSLDDGLYVSAEISTDKLVDGATLSLAYESEDLLCAGYYANDNGTTFDDIYGSLTAACTVEF